MGKNHGDRDSLRKLRGGKSCTGPSLSVVAAHRPGTGDLAPIIPLRPLAGLSLTGVAAGGEAIEREWIPETILDIEPEAHCVAEMLQHWCSDPKYRLDEDGKLVLNENGEPVQVAGGNAVSFSLLATSVLLMVANSQANENEQTKILQAPLSVVIQQFATLRLREIQDHLRSKGTGNASDAKQ